MPDTQIADIFLLVAAVCIVLLTIIASVVAYAVFRAALQVRSIVRLFQAETENLILLRNRLIDDMRFAGKWAKIMGRHFIRPNE